MSGKSEMLSDTMIVLSVSIKIICIQFCHLYLILSH